MPEDHAIINSLPPAVGEFLAKAQSRLRDGKTERVRLCPLILRSSLKDLLSRRKRVFDIVEYAEADYGVQVTFTRRLKRSMNHPNGHECIGEFNLLSIRDDLRLVCSELASEEHKNGPSRFTEKSYPLARRPFFSSTALVRLIEQYSSTHSWAVTTRDTFGYHRQSRSARRDTERQSPSAAAREMAEQQRQTHRMVVDYAEGSRRKATLSFDRNAALSVLGGSITDALKNLVFPGVEEAWAKDPTYAVQHCPEPRGQEAVEIEFVDEPFDSYDAMRTLCGAVRRGDGLNVSIIPLNPYLQAQILDFY